ncbi:hypothetical protein DXG03_007865 [Asterophora parasitica]|uniref:RNA-dependent RNA polymerase n=1 Tax=Asterophora parasitica TaxID=117018 RepID=A0A9P7G7N8_9AGAR|nr:hypothetical protein DXG03_007865 [Asterophora parasitica]
MEVFMRDVSYSATPNQLTAALANIFHGPRYSGLSPLPLNFHVFLFKDKRGGRQHSGSGTLTLPNRIIGAQFLGEYGEGSHPRLDCIVCNRRIKFSTSQRQPRSDIVEIITRQPYIDPRVAEEKDTRDRALRADTVSFTTLQFGWECRDSVFSIEWEHTIPDYRGSVSFDDDRRELRIKIPRSMDTLAVAVRFAQINAASVHTTISKQPIVYMTLFTPPAFEIETTPLRTRLAALPIEGHARVSPYTSFAIRLVCSSTQELATFRKLSKVVQLQHDNRETYVERRGLFSVTVEEELQHRLRRLNWCISFQLESLLRSLAVDMTELLDLLPDIVTLTQEKGKRYTASMLRDFGPRAMAFWLDPGEEQGTLRDLFLQAQRDFEAHGNASLQATDGSLFESYHVEITPTTMRLSGPQFERSNRVIRRYHPDHHESFLRVSFVEEGRLQYRFDRDVDGPAFIRSRVGPFLLQGLIIAGRKFRFLAYSQSALKEHAVWFVKPFRDPQHGYVDAPTIITSIGSFANLPFDRDLMRCPARYGARISQAFTATDASVNIEEVEEIFPIDDIKTSSGDYCFTDGVGTMSKELAIEISQELKAKRRRGRYRKAHPRAFQIRFQGSKGMLSVDYTLTGRAICLRPSMIKFEDPVSREIEIARAFDKPGPYFLNRPLIMLLEGLGVKYEVFKLFQDKAVRETEESAKSLGQAARMFETHGLGSSYRLPSVMLGLEKLGIDNIYGSAFYQRVLEFAVHHVLRLLKNRARIPIPDAWTLVGVADVHMFLKEGEIFACIKPTHGHIIYLEGPVLISRSPTIHPGDVQIVHAIGPPPDGSCFAKEPLPNTVVFSVLGSRPLPSCLGGGDLDGDVYNLIPLNSRSEFNILQTYQPAKYEAAPKKLVDHDSTMTDVAEFVMEYINSDVRRQQVHFTLSTNVLHFSLQVVGIVAINWLILADQCTNGIFDKDCLKLSRLHSDAVDYPKSGNPVALDQIPKLRFKVKPDWNAPETVNSNSANYYRSERAIGRLFRDITLPVASADSGRRQRHRRRQEPVDELSRTLDSLSIADDDEDYVQEAVTLKVSQFLDTTVEPSIEVAERIQANFHHYVSELNTICANHTLSSKTCLTEEEALVGTIVQKTSQPRLRQEMTANLRERTDILARSIREDLAGGDEGDEDEELLRLNYLERAWRAWKLSILERKSFGGESFGWLALGAIFDAIKDIEDAELDEARSRFY